MTPLWNIFALIWKGFFTRSLNLHLHLGQYLFFVSQTLNTALASKKKKGKKETHPAFALNCVKSFSERVRKARKVFGISLCLTKSREWLQHGFEGHQMGVTVIDMRHRRHCCFPSYMLSPDLYGTFRFSCLQDLKSWLSTTLLRRYLSLGWCWKIPVKFRQL